MQNFSLTISEEDVGFLKRLVKESIGRGLSGNRITDENKLTVSLPEPDSEVLNAELGAFVTLHLRGMLRGCIGNVVGSGPLYRTVAAMAQAAAFDDPRFPPLSPAEADEIDVEISVMGPVSPCRNVNDIEIGKHGLIIRKGLHSGLLLPQVAKEHGWDTKTFLQQTCVKAGLDTAAWEDAWRHQGQQAERPVERRAGQNEVELYWFEAVVV